MWREEGSEDQESHHAASRYRNPPDDFFFRHGRHRADRCAELSLAFMSTRAPNRARYSVRVLSGVR